MCAVGVVVAVAVVLPAIPGRPGPAESQLAELVRGWGGRAIIHNGLVRGIDFAGAQVSDDDLVAVKAAIGRLDPKCLREINLSGSATGDIGIEHLQGIEAYQLQLCLDHTRITDKSLSKITTTSLDWETLLIRRRPCQEAGLLQLRRHPTLETVYIGGSNVTPGLIQRLEQQGRWCARQRPHFEASER